MKGIDKRLELNGDKFNAFMSLKVRKDCRKTCIPRTWVGCVLVFACFVVDFIVYLVSGCLACGG